MALASREEDHSRFRELTALFDSEYGPGGFDVPSQMKALREELQKHGTDMDAPCTHDDQNVCWLPRELAPWNEILFKVGAGLYEEDFQRLTLKLLADEWDLHLLAKEDEVVAAACLLHLVLKEHRCIQQFVMSGHDVPPTNSFWLPVIKMSLKASQGLKSLDLTFERESDYTKRHFFDGAAEIKTLKDFYFHDMHSSSDLNTRSVCQIVKGNCENLQTVRINLEEDIFVPPEDLFGSLGKCIALTSLELHCLKEIEAEYLAKFMIENKTITALTVGGSGMQRLEWICRIVRENSTLLKLNLSGLFPEDACILARELQQNTTLKYIHCRYAFVSSKDVSALADMLKVNETIREITTVGDEVFLTNPIAHDRAVELAEAISCNKTLTKMDLSGAVFEAKSVVLLIQALEQNSTLSKLRVIVRPTFGDCDLSPVMVAIETAGTCDRLEVLWHKEWFPPAAPMLQASTLFAEIRINKHCQPQRVVLEKLFENLRGNRFVTLFSISGRISDDAWCKLGSFLSTNNTIETLVFDSCSGSNSAMKKFSDGLAQNSSVRHIKMTGMRSIPLDDDPLRLAIGRNRNITSADIGIDSGAFVLEYLYLSRSILQVNTDKQRRVSRRLHEMLQRNLSLVNGAVRFVLNPTTDRMSAGLFHEFQYSPEMFRRLKEATGESDTETKRRILCAANFVEEHFFVIVGVVKSSLVCHRIGGKVLQDLNDVCLRKIASYLRVSDVVP